MRLLAPALLSVAVLLAGCTLGPPAPPHRSEGDAPEWSVGDYWVWEEPAVLLGTVGQSQEKNQFRWEVVAVQSVAGVESYVVEETVKQAGNDSFRFPDRFNKSVATQEVVTSQGVQPALSAYRMPFVPGSTVKMGESVELRVQFPTETTTPAGKYRTIPVERWEPVGENGTVVKSVVYYYSAAVGNPVRTEVYQAADSFYVRELVEFRCAACSAN